DGLGHLMNASEKLEMGIAELYSLFGKTLPGRTERLDFGTSIVCNGIGWYAPDRKLRAIPFR
ncbi:MAG: hypothetical protein KKD59_00080, partial [Acidobacteria bacterium]|nr:hypothetical protein [Acidobacteriota bacterium]